MGNKRRRSERRGKENKVVNITAKKVKRVPQEISSEPGYIRIGIDKSLLMYVLLLMALGLIMIYSASSYEAMLKHNDAKFYLTRQLFATVVALLGMAVAANIDYHFFLRWNKAIYVISLILVFLVITPLGKEINGARRWLGKGSISIQPAEIAKLAVILLTAVLISKTPQKALDTFKGMVRVLVPSAIMSFMVLVFTKNLSSASIIFLIPVVMVYVASRNHRIFAIAFISMVVVIGILVALVVSGTVDVDNNFRLARVAAWLHPEAYASGKAFQTLQALYSIGSGGLFGKGLGQSMQKLGSLPEAQNDMIFSIVCEELGLIGALAIMLLFGILIHRCAKAAENAMDLKGSMIAIGVMAHLALQVILNIAVVSNVIPNTGVTLPFISYGGSSVVFTLGEIGILLNVTGRVADE